MGQGEIRLAGQPEYVDPFWARQLGDVAVAENLDLAMVMHSRRYRENSRIVEFFSEQHGRFAAIARVSAKAGGSARYQPFSELYINWSGRGELKTLKNADTVSQWSLSGRASVCGLYLNELLLYLLDKDYPSPELYQHYREALQDLAGNPRLAQTLRRFEKQLLNELGYLPSLVLESVDGPLYFSPSQGIGGQPYPDAFAVSYAAVEALARDDWHRQSAAKEIKLMLTACIDRLLNGRALRSRELIRSMSQKNP